MKILYIADDRRAAAAATPALRTIAPHVDIAWVSNEEDARGWIAWNRDVAAILVEMGSDSDSAAWAAFVSGVRRQGTAARVIAVSADPTDPRLAALAATADQMVTKDLTFPGSLPGAVSGPSRLAPDGASQARPRRRALYIGDAALARESLGRSIDVVERVPSPGATFDRLPAHEDGSLTGFDIVLIEHAYPGIDSLAILRDIAGRRLVLPAVVVADWDEQLAVSAITLGAFDFVAKSRESLRAILFRFHRLMAHSTLITEHAQLQDAHARAQLTIGVTEPVTSPDQAAREATLVARLADATASTTQLEQTLADRETALRLAEDRLASSAAAAEARLADLQARYDARLSEQAASRHAALETALAREAAHRQTLAQALADAGVERAAAMREHAGQLAAVSAEADALRHRLSETTAALEHAERQAAAQERAAAEDAAALHAREDDLARSRGESEGLRQALDESRAAAQEALEGVSRDHAADRARLEALIAEGEARLQDETAHWLALEETAARALAHAKAASDDAARRYAEQSATLRDTEARVTAETSRAAATAAALSAAEARTDEERRAAAERAEALQARFAREIAAAREQIERLTSAFADERAGLVAARAGLEDDLARSRGESERLRQALDESRASAQEALERAVRDHTAERARLEALVAEGAARLQDETARHQASEETAARALADATAAGDAAAREYAERLAAASAAAEALRHELAETTAALARAEQQATAQAVVVAEQVAALRAREDDLTGLRAAHDGLQQTLAHVQTAAQDALEHASRDHAAERARLEALVAEGAARLQDETARHQASEESAARALAAAKADSDAAARSHAEELAAMATAAEALTAAETSRAAAAAAALSAVEARAAEERRAAAERAETLQAGFAREIAAANEQIERLTSAFADERAGFFAARAALEDDLARSRGESEGLRQALDEARAAAQEALERAVRDHAAERARLEALVAEGDARLQSETVRHQVSEEAAALALADSRRQFDGSPAGLCRWSRDGGVMHVNHALAGMLGYGTAEELQAIDFAAGVFESGGEFTWLIERCLASRVVESIDTTWVKKDGERIIVRVLAVSTAPGMVSLAAQDITALRVVEERLRRSQRMESVARYASEVAATCDTLLRHVEEEGQRWLDGLDSDGARYQGQLLLEEVTRASGFLRRLAAYGTEQQSAADLVEVNEVLRDLEPVLRRVAGRQVDVVLPKGSTRLNLDVDAERFERILVNVAAYGRERMPSGGRLVIDLAPVMVDRAFVAKHPNVRPGAHVLLEVTEVRRAAAPGAPVGDDAVSGPGSRATGAGEPGVDLGALQALVSDCGGHLWMNVKPPGDMELRIHLPRRVLDRPEPRAPLKQPVLARWMNRVPGRRH